MNIKELYEYVLKHISERYEQSADNLEDIMSRIGWHESRNKVDCHQMGGGPGRGIFQFEEGVKEGGETAMNRLIRWFDAHECAMPNWANVGLNGVDASVLCLEAQKMMFLANVRYHPKASFKGLDLEGLPEWWAKYHWAGPEDTKAERIAAFNSSMEYYKV